MKGEKMATLKAPFALDRSLNTTEVTPRNIADVLAEGLSHITGRTASEVGYDNTDSGLTADNVQDALDEIAESVPTLPTTDIQTAVDEFSTYNGGILDSLKVSLSPNQDLHGYPEPWVGGASKNKCAMTLDGIKTLNVDGTWSGNVYTWRGITYTVLTDDADNIIGFDTNGTANERGWLFISNADYGETTVYFNGTTLNGYTFTSGNPSAVDAIRCIAYNYVTKMSYIIFDNGVTTNHEKWYPMVRLSSESDPTFAPYTNICPITGHTQSKVEVGTNKLNPDNIVQGSLTTSAVSTRCSTRGNLTIPISVGQTITVSRQSSTINFAVAVTDSSMSVLFDSGWQSGSYTYVSAYDGYVELVFAKQDGTDITPSNVKSANFMVEFGSTPSTYVPYAKGTYSLTVNLGGTYYSGTLDVVSGVLTINKVKAVTPTRGSLDSSGKLYAISFSGGTIHNYTDTAIATPYVICSHLDVDSLAGARDTQRKCICQYAGSVYIGGYVGEETALDNMLASADFSIVFELATPQPIQLSPTMVKALVGENHLSAPLDGQEITESKYKQLFTFDDVIAYIQSLS